MVWYALAAVVAVAAVLAGHFLAKGLYALAIVALILVGVGAYAQAAHDDSSGARGSSSLVGGCASFNVYAQNQFPPLGTLRWSAPDVTAKREPGFAGNELITVDGWVKAQSPYGATNDPPWNADVWFHLADGSGWVTFAGVRSAPTGPDPQNGLGPGSDPVPLDPVCQGSVRL